MKYPDKSKYKTTVTARLRSQIQELADDFREKKVEPVYLEIGCDCGYTIASVSSSFSKCVGIDIDSNRIEQAKKIVTPNTSLICGTSEQIPVDNYHVILIDANHSLQAIEKDYAQVLLNNKAEDYVIIFHDYGLVKSGTRTFLTRYKIDFISIGQEKNWNPLGGPTDDYEAALVWVTTKK